MNLMDNIYQQITNTNQQVRIIFPEGTNQSIIDVAIKLQSTVIEPILVYQTKHDVPPSIIEHKINHLVIAEADVKQLAQSLFDLRKGKVTLDQATELVQQANYFAVLMVKQQQADGMVGGINYATSDILRPALQIIKTKPNVTLASSVFLMLKDQEQYVFTDCALNIYPDAAQLMMIGKLGYEAAKIIGIKNPQLAFLSYSTKGSGHGESVDKVKAAVALCQQDPELKTALIDGEFQFDSAFVDGVRVKKAPNSTLTKQADVYVFPNIDAGNIGYKIAQRMGQYMAVGPIIMGLNNPVNDLSRGATVDDIYNTVLITAYIDIINKQK